jgi:4-amino-4-deoxy-L-arabinose transferase-like glycosyltransferase
LWPVWALVSLLGLLWFGNLGLRSLTDPDEGRYAEIPREMLASGDWLAPQLNGIQYLEKPPLQYWSTAALYEAFGVRPWVSRLYTAGLGFGLLVLVGFAGRRLFNASAGMYAALILGSSTLFYALAHINTLDMGLTFYLSVAMLAFVYAHAVAGDARVARGWMWLVWLGLGLATLQKGLVGLVLPGFALVLYVLWQRAWSLLRHIEWLAGLAIVLAINLPWWWLMQRRNHGFVDWFFVHEHYTRFLTNEHGRSQPWWYFSALLLVGVLPWLAPTVRGFWSALNIPGASRARFSNERFLAVWAAAIFVFFAPSGSKLAPYILPMLPPLALLAGRYLSERPQSVPALRATFMVATLMGLVLACLPFIAARMSLAVERRTGYENIARLGMLAGLLLLFATALALLLDRRRSRVAAVATLATGWIASLALLTNGSNELERWKGGSLLATDIAAHLKADTPFFCLDTYPQSAIFLLAHTCTVVGDAGELETRFDEGTADWLPDDAAFVAAWTAAPHAVAVVEPRQISRWQALASGATIAVSKPYGVVLVK